ncbi:tRNA threonylcarbamoyladenosine biosynthesis protein TsaB [Anaerobacterium chartisolvens]|uniref:tRNA threonylcarbamoyladenosine biosynthesis protein TsaB n=1 Tax=Anaerobacterium chartisolvens TaxID=1297424 RepID=A0A369ATP1_9FIRM|nr:tRNA (adenosine(37)-N6)-threonylcarbamoyltransferase complex dimerization subunit type 1 TsaB [Anaerobacterium chartisolvens]RCX12742.1 tRNA threonylcarbamoyladenosine biosynthesis protein TsaB [Anaerobacterium chartisolvens]
MRILAVDTSASVAAAAVMDSGTILGEYLVNNKKTHSQKLMPMIKELMDSLELCPQDIDLYAASIGPGSFTGLRIGVTTIKAMAFSLGKPVASVPTLDAIAYNIPMNEAVICPIMDARNLQVYTSLYCWEKGGQKRIADYMGISVYQLIDIIKQKKQKVIFAGDGVQNHRELLQSELDGICSFAPGSLLLQRASAVAQIAFEKSGGTDKEDGFSMLPFYLRKSQAERELEKNHILKL